MEASIEIQNSDDSRGLLLRRSYTHNDQVRNQKYDLHRRYHPKGVTLWFGCQNAPNRYWRNLNLTGMISFDAHVLWSATDVDSFDTAVWSFYHGKNLEFSILGSQEAVCPEVSWLYKGHYRTPTQTMHYYKGNPSNVPYKFVLLDPPQNGEMFHHPCCTSFQTHRIHVWYICLHLP